MRTLSFEEIGSVAGGDGPSVNYAQASLGAALFGVGTGIVAAAGIAASAVAAPVIISVAGGAGLALAASGGAVVGTSLRGVQSWLAKEGGSP